MVIQNTTDYISWLKSKGFATKLLVFDLDGTLTISKTAIDHEMASLLLELLAKGQRMAVTSGQAFKTFDECLLRSLGNDSNLLKNLFIFPTCAATCYRYDIKTNNWEEVYAEILTDAEKQKIFTAFEKVFKEIHYAHPQKIYGGGPVEDRRTQVSFSPLGQAAPVDLKETWAAKYNDVRIKICTLVSQYLLDFEVRLAGITTIDVTRKGIDKGYGIKKMEKQFGITRDNICYIGDLLFPGGNDYPVAELGVPCVMVKNPEETKKIIHAILACRGGMTF